MGKELIQTIVIVAILGLSNGRPSERISSSDDLATSGNPEPIKDCVTSCVNVSDGDYQSCDSCQMYVTCVNGSIEADKSCPPGLVWDDNDKNCEMTSHTCKKDENLTFMLIDDSHEENNSGNLDEMLPESLNIKMSMDDDDMALNLTKNSHIDAMFPVVIANNGKAVSKMPRKEDFALYNDMDSMASFIVRMDKKITGGAKRRYEGMFRMKDKEYYLMPTPEPGTRQHDRLKRSLEPGTNLHDLYKRSTSSKNSGSSYMIRKIRPVRSDITFDNSTIRPSLAALTANQEEVLKAARDANTLPVGKQTHRVDILLFLDYAIYNKWYRLSKETTAARKEEDAVKNIRFYFAHLMNGVDFRYNSIENPDLEIYFKLNGMYIATTPKDSPWTEYNRPHSFYHTDAYDALDDFELWLNKSKSVLPPFDLATLFSGYKLYSGKRADGSLRTIGGLADIKGACRYHPVWYGASINYDSGLYAATQTATHEIGHNLGSFHDGDYRHAASCSGKDRYIMASAPGVLTDETYMNAFKFSPCSIRSITDYLMYLTMEGKNCLQQSKDHPTVAVNTSILLGQLFTPDHQCQQILGHQSYYCGGGDMDANICREMWCYNPTSKRCYITAEQRAADGTSCGNKKWCDGGDCVYSPLAAEAPESCLYGDYKDPFQPMGLKCDQLIEREPFNCYREDYNAKCCKSCAKKKDQNKKGCEYGDHSSSCKTLVTHHCYQESKRQSCCEECDKRANKENKGCEWGDSANWCATSIQYGYHCYGQNITCCKSCAKFRIPNAEAGCEYGNTVSWCNTIQTNQCYNDRLRSKCCQKCKEMQDIHDPECKYGDRQNDCSQSDCKNPLSRQNCCKTCKAYRTTTTTTPATTSTTRATTSKPTNDCKDIATWCSNYVPTYPDSCNRDRNVITHCCHSCSLVNRPTSTTAKPTTTVLSSCVDNDVTWCQTYIMADNTKLCENINIIELCCETCSTNRQSNAEDAGLQTVMPVDQLTVRTVKGLSTNMQASKSLTISTVLPNSNAISREAIIGNEVTENSLLTNQVLIASTHAVFDVDGRTESSTANKTNDINDPNESTETSMMTTQNAVIEGMKTTEQSIISRTKAIDDAIETTKFSTKTSTNAMVNDLETTKGSISSKDISSMHTHGETSTNVGLMSTQVTSSIRSRSSDNPDLRTATRNSKTMPTLLAKTILTTMNIDNFETTIHKSSRGTQKLTDQSTIFKTTERYITDEKVVSPTENTKGKNDATKVISNTSISTSSTPRSTLVTTITKSLECVSDRESWCEEYIQERYEEYCKEHIITFLCCKTCMDGLAKSKKEKLCPENHVDVSWCDKYVNINLGNCYDHSFRQSCCSACLRNRTKDNTCPYGDRYLWCYGGYYCWTESDRKKCCNSCR